MFKEGAFEPSSPLRHSAELANILTAQVETKPVLFIYCYGGPDHRVTYISVKVALIALYRKLDLDYLCAMRTAPYHSYRNPVERIMSICEHRFPNHWFGSESNVTGNGSGSGKM